VFSMTSLRMKDASLLTVITLSLLAKASEESLAACLSVKANNVEL
jgi:hypothetical protein